MDYLQGYDYTRIWIDIEIYSWSTDKNSNRDFITRMVNQLNKRGSQIGIYSSKRCWDAIVGLDWTALNMYPL